MKLLEETVQDVRYALRMLTKHRAFTAIAVLTLALGIGATTAIFSVVYALLLKPLPYRDSSRLVQLVVNVPAADVPSGTPIRATGSMSIAELTELRPRTRPLSHVGLYAQTLVTLSGRDEAARLQGAQVQSAVLEMLGARPMLGRLLARDDDLSVILSYHAWRRHFAGRTNVLGNTLTLDGKGYSVIGVMPEEFQFPDPRTEFWIPLVLEPGRQPDRVGRAPMMARLADGVSIQAAAAEVDSILREPRGWRYELVRAQDALVAPVKRALLVFTIAVGFVLLIACVNVASLLFARTSARQRDIAIRIALGAGRTRIVRHLLTESLMLALAGGVAGTVLAFGGIRLLSTLATTLSRLDLGTLRALSATQ
jgi:putative ABC transport system permease protein